MRLMPDNHDINIYGNSEMRLLRNVTSTDIASYFPYSNAIRVYDNTQRFLFSIYLASLSEREQAELFDIILPILI